jgi:WD40 repeat protein
MRRTRLEALMSKARYRGVDRRASHTSAEISTRGPVAAGEPRASEPGRYDAFLSYAREDGEFVVAELRDQLRRRGHEVWVDVDIVGGAKWHERVKRGIEACKALVFVVSPASVSSEACRQELNDAVTLNKLVIPVIHRDVPDGTLPQALAEAEWVFLRDGDDRHAGVDRLVEALETDLEWRDQHTRLAGRTREWLDSDRDSSYQLRGSDLRAAEAWLTQQEGHRQRPTHEHAEYIAASRQAASRRVYTLLGGLTLALVIAIALAVFALLQRNTAIRERQSATSRELAAQSLLHRDTDPPLSLLLAIESAKASRTPETLAALRVSLSANHLLRTLADNAGPVRAVAWSRDGRLVASGAQDGSVRIRTAANGRVRHLLRPRLFDVRGVAFDPSGARLLINAREAPNGEAMIWPFARGAQPLALPDPIDFRVWHATWSRDGRRVLTAPCVTAPARLWDATTGRLLRSLGRAGCSDGQFSPNGRLVATAGPGGTAYLWDASTGAQLHAMPASGPDTGLLAAGARSVISVRFSPDGARLLTAGGDGSARVFDVRSGRQLAQAPRHADAVTLAVWSPDGREVATASDDRTATLWYPDSGDAVNLGGHAASVVDVQFSHDGQSVLTAGADGLVQVFGSGTGTLIAQLHGHDNGEVRAVFSPDDRSVLSGGEDGTVRVWDAGIVRPVPSARLALGRREIVGGWNTFNRPSGETDPTAPLFVSAPGSTDGVRAGADVRDSLRGNRVALLSSAPHRVTCAAFDGSSHRIFTCGQDARYDAVPGRLWEARTGRLLHVLKGTAGAAVNGALSDDGTLLGTVDRAGVVTVWRTATAKPMAVFRRHTRSRPPYSLSVSIRFSRDASLMLTGDSAGKAYLWRVRDGTVLNTYSGLPQPPRSVNGAAGGAISDDNGMVLFTDPWDPVGVLQEVGRVGRVGTLTGTRGGIASASFNSDGSLLVTSGDDGDRVWDVASRRSLLVLPDEPGSVRFGRDGTTIVANGPEPFATSRSYRQTFACDVCGGIDRLLALARSRTARALTPGERRQYLHR